MNSDTDSDIEDESKSDTKDESESDTKDLMKKNKDLMEIINNIKSTFNYSF